MLSAGAEAKASTSALSWCRGFSSSIIFSHRWPKRWFLRSCARKKSLRCRFRKRV